MGYILIILDIHLDITALPNKNTWKSKIKMTSGPWYGDLTNPPMFQQNHRRTDFCIPTLYHRSMVSAVSFESQLKLGSKAKGGLNKTNCSMNPTSEMGQRNTINLLNSGWLGWTPWTTTFFESMFEAPFFGTGPVLVHWRYHLWLQHVVWYLNWYVVRSPRLALDFWSHFGPKDLGKKTT